MRRSLKVETEEGALSGINVEASGIGRLLKTIGKGKEAKEEQEKDKADKVGLVFPLAPTSRLTVFSRLS